MRSKHWLLAGGFVMLLSGCGGATPDEPSLGGATADNPSVDSVQPDSSPQTSDSSPQTSAGTDSTADPRPVSPTDEAVAEVDELELALATGDAMRARSARQLEEAALQAIDDATHLHSEVLIELFDLAPDGTARRDGRSLTAVDWNPTHDAALLKPTFGRNTPFLVTNSVFADGYEIQASSLGVLGIRESRDDPAIGSRYLALGGHPFRNARRSDQALNEDMHALMANSIMWLTTREDLDRAPSDIVIAQQDQGHYFPDEKAMREWLDARFDGQVRYNEANACDGAALPDCVARRPDLLIVSQHLNDADDLAPASAAIRAALDQGTPVMYLHLNGDLKPLGEYVLGALDIDHEGDNYWRRLELAAFDPTDIFAKTPEELEAVRTLLTHFRDDSFQIDWSECDDENCSVSDTFNTQFLKGAEYVQALMQNLDRARIDRFSSGGFRLQKLLALLGDRYRSGVTFPMDKNTTADGDFLRALYADHALYQYRARAEPWSDLGNFARSDYTHVTPVTRRVRLTSKARFRSTGAYALPGRAVTVTRHDDSDVSVGVFVNTIRNGATHVYAENGYKRPRFLRTAEMPLAPGESIRFTSATGGPVQLAFDANDHPVELVFENVGEHAHWRSPADDSTFDVRLAANELDWAEIASPGFEIHSTREKMLASMEDGVLGEFGGSAQALVDATMRYLHDYPHRLAGFSGAGIGHVDEIQQFALDHDLTVYELDLVKHMNADQATCGYGCSGNPYDAYWAFSPVGHGDLHELGHGLERARFRFEGWPGHTITNFYSYYAKSQFHKDTGRDPECQSLPFDTLYAYLSASLAHDDPSGYLQNTLWREVAWSEGAAMIIQMMMAAQDHGALENGWHLLARMHLLERNFTDAVRDDAGWESRRDGLGMSQYTQEDARQMSNNDWLLVSLSHATGFDFRNYLDLWGQPYTALASEQVAALSLPSMPVDYYVSSGRGFCKGEGFDGRKLSLDGSDAEWPLP